MSLTKTFLSLFLELMVVSLVLYGLFYLGSGLGSSWQILVLGLLIYLYWHIYFIFQLLDWFKLGQLSKPPPSLGIWRIIFMQIETVQNKAFIKHKKLNRILDNYRNFFDSIPDAALILNHSKNSIYKIEWFNKNASVYLGLKKKKHLGMDINQVIDHELFANFLLGNERQQDLELPSPLDNNKMLSLNLLPYSDDLQILLVRDISKTYRINKVRKDFVANVSHELRTPLTVINGYLETLEEHYSEDPTLLYPIQSMRQQSKRMVNLVQDLLTLSNLESNSAKAVSTELVDVPAMVEMLSSEARLLNKQKNHKIKTFIDQGLMIQGNEKELQSAFSNLIANAIRYTPAGGEINIRWYQKKQSIYFSVEDNGEGIATKHCQRLTERFYRVDKGRSRNDGGTGLGLAIVKHILNHHHAELEISSKLGKGSTFTCKFEL
ncbi:MAG: phosphate regulon sensor histidine kinase PhoR [Pseudomonadota bacterium]